MDLNYLFHRHQTSLMRADAAACAPSRRAHHALATGYAGRIGQLQRQSGASRWVLSTTTHGDAA